jgi:hypothetical protein
MEREHHVGPTTSLPDEEFYSNTGLGFGLNGVQDTD